MQSINIQQPSSPEQGIGISFKKNHKKRHFSLILPLLIIAIAATGTAIYFYTGYTNLKNNPQEAAAAGNRALLDKVSQLMVLPQGEDPTIATVTDPEQLKDQPFFTNAKIGDKVLIYTNARKAILYNPADHKIVEVAPVVIGEGGDVAGESTQANNQQATEQTPAEPQE